MLKREEREKYLTSFYLKMGVSFHHIYHLLSHSKAMVPMLLCEATQGFRNVRFISRVRTTVCMRMTAVNPYTPNVNEDEKRKVQTQNFLRLRAVFLRIKG